MLPGIKGQWTGINWGPVSSHSSMGKSPVRMAYVELLGSSLRQPGGAHPASSCCSQALPLPFPQPSSKVLLLGPNPAGPSSTQAQIPAGCWKHPLSPCLAQLETLNTAQGARIQRGLGSPGTPGCVGGVRHPSKADVGCWGSLHLQGTEVLPVPRSAVGFGPPCAPPQLIYPEEGSSNRAETPVGGPQPFLPWFCHPSTHLISNQLP